MLFKYNGEIEAFDRIFSVGEIICGIICLQDNTNKLAEECKNICSLLQIICKIRNLTILKMVNTK